MAETISWQSKLAFSGTNGSYSNTTSSGTEDAVLGTSAKAHHTTQSVGTSVEAVSLGDVTSTARYYVRLENKEATNFVTVYLRVDSTPTDKAIGVIKPGEVFGPIPMIGTGTSPYSAGYPLLYVKGDTAACNVEVVAVDGPA